MEDKYEFDLLWLLPILAMLDKNTVKGSEENGNESEGSKNTLIIDKKD